MKDLKLITKFSEKHRIALLLLLTVSAIFTVIKFSSKPLMQFQILGILIIVYLSWALFYHFQDKSLTFEIMIEYILTALLAIVILYGTLL